ncbi:MAG: hypothetical protein ACJA11_002725 [Glaciecola sp.]|jgi:hypothetical protein
MLLKDEASRIGCWLGACADFFERSIAPKIAFTLPLQCIGKRRD